MEHNYLEINSKIEENRHSEGKHSCRKYIIPIRAESNKIWIFHYRCCPILSNSVNIYQFKLKESRKLHNERCNQHDRNVFSWWLEWKKISEMFEHYSNKIFFYWDNYKMYSNYLYNLHAVYSMDSTQHENVPLKLPASCRLSQLLLFLWMDTKSRGTLRWTRRALLVKCLWNKVWLSVARKSQ